MSIFVLTFYIQSKGLGSSKVTFTYIGTTILDLCIGYDKTILCICRNFLHMDGSSTIHGDSTATKLPSNELFTV